MTNCLRCVLAAALLFSLLFTGCGNSREYSGFRIENTEALSQTIRTAMLHRTGVRISFQAHTLDRGEIESIVDTLMAEAFYESDAPDGGDYLRYQYGGYELRHSVEEKNKKYYYLARIFPKYYTTKEQEEAVDERIDSLLEEFSLKKDATAYEKIRCVRDYICETVTYDTVHKHQPGSQHIQSTAYGALFYHTALCQGYAVLCYRLLKELGVDVRIVTGEAAVSDVLERHAWNIVEIDGVYYNLDVTMDAVQGTEDYFLKSDQEFKKDHTRDSEYQSEAFYESYPMSKENYLMEKIG